MSPLVKKLVWALGLSLSVNLFLLGFGAARWFGGHAGGPRGPMFEEPLGPGRTMKLFKHHAPELRVRHRAVHEARQRVARALTAEPFDRAALAEALGALRAATQQGQTELHQALLDAAATMPLAEREALAKSRLLHDLAGRPGPK